VQCMLWHVQRGLVVDSMICEVIYFQCLGCLRVRTRGVKDGFVDVGRVVGMMSRSPICCRQSCTLLRYVLGWQGCELWGVWNRCLMGCCWCESVCNIHGCIVCHKGRSNL
jgi:hypothetical protein